MSGRLRPSPWLLLISVILAGCAGWFPTEEGYRQLLDTWIGSTGEHLVANWGVPQGEHVSPDGNKIYEFKDTRTYTVSGGTKSEEVWVDGHYIYVDVPQPDEVRTSWCNTTFYLSAADVIQSYAFNGPDCTAYEVTPKSAAPVSAAAKRPEPPALCGLIDAPETAPPVTDGIQLCGTPLH